MRDVDAAPGPPADVEDFSQGGRGLLRVVAAHVRDVDAAERRDLLAQRRQFVLVGIDARHVVETARQPDRALLHPFAHESPSSAPVRRRVGFRGSRPITSIRTLPFGISVQTLMEHCAVELREVLGDGAPLAAGRGEVAVEARRCSCRMYACVAGEPGAKATPSCPRT